MCEVHPHHKRIWRDIHNVWQWGITDDDLIAKMKSLGFVLYYYKNCGIYHLFISSKKFENHAFMFIKEASI
ncbi:MAG: hypothetical protein QW468_01820 [Candidatus Bathyarchaeia archaeon]